MSVDRGTDTGPLERLATGPGTLIIPEDRTAMVDRRTNARKKS